MFQYSIVLLLIAIPTVISEGACKSPDNANTCYKIFKELSSALVKDKGNLYRMQQAFFYAPNADPVLVKVKYNVSYGDNITKDQVQYCGNADNTSAIVINETEIIRGWTSRGVYYIITPLTLNNMQMILPLAILRLINEAWRSTSGSPEMDTFLWDGTYELPTLLINLHITSLPCIPSKDVFNYTLDELNAHLKMYTNSQDLLQSRSTAIHAGDIAYTLSEDRLLCMHRRIYPLQDQYDAAYYVLFYYYSFGYFFLVFWIMIFLKNKKLLKSVSTTIKDHIDFVISAVFVGYLFVISEFIAIAVYFGDDHYSLAFHLYLWTSTLIGFLIILIWIICVCCYKKRNWEKADVLKLLHAIFAIGIVLFLLHIYYYSLPTFLLLLVYPTKVITVVAYLTTFVFVTIIISSISIHQIIVYIISYHKFGLPKLDCCRCIILIVNTIFVLVYPVFVFVLVIQFLYLLVLGEASAISAGPYTVLSLIPTAAISAAIWLVKNKVFVNSNIDIYKKEDKNKSNEDKNISATNDSEALTLVVNEDTPFNGNDQEMGSYGATGTVTELV